MSPVFPGIATYLDQLEIAPLLRGEAADDRALKAAADLIGLAWGHPTHRHEILAEAVARAAVVFARADALQAALADAHTHAGPKADDSATDPDAAFWAALEREAAADKAKAQAEAEAEARALTATEAEANDDAAKERQFAAFANDEAAAQARKDDTP